MERNIKIYTVSCLVFLLILSFSGTFGGLLGDALYFLAFIIPVVLSLLSIKKKNAKDLLPNIKTKNAGLIVLTSPACLFAVFALSYLTASLIFALSGKESPSQLTGSPTKDILTLALAPAIFEEALFRYLPMKLIAPYSKKTAVLISTLFFSLAHASLFSIPYAALAGFIFILADIAADSILPSVILHFINNIISIVWEYSLAAGAEVIFISVFAVIAAASLILTFIYRKSIASALLSQLERDDRANLPSFTAALIIPTLLIAILNIL